ncbi:MAG: VOC family protein [Euryarchaeota archaeon]|nr:VOC family protein [Euryarchaeota archaeon]
MTRTVTANVEKLTHVTAIVSDLDKALDFYTRVLGMEKRDDEVFEFNGTKMRWLTVGCPGQALSIVLSTPMPAPGSKSDPDTWVGNGTMWVLQVMDCSGAVEALKAEGVTISSGPEEAPWGVSAVVRDPDGNPFNLVQPRRT